VLIFFSRASSIVRVSFSPAASNKRLKLLDYLTASRGFQ